MNHLYPIIRRVRRPLLPVDAAILPATIIDEVRDPAAVVPVVVELPRDYVPSAPEPVTSNKRAKGKTVSKTA